MAFLTTSWRIMMTSRVYVIGYNSADVYYPITLIAKTKIDTLLYLLCVYDGNMDGICWQYVSKDVLFFFKWEAHKRDNYNCYWAMMFFSHLAFKFIKCHCNNLCRVDCSNVRDISTSHRLLNNAAKHPHIPTIRI